MTYETARWILLVVLGAWLGHRLARRRRAWTLRDRVVLITGGSRGLGLVLARACARAGARVAICAREPSALLRAERDLLRLSPQVLAVPCDLTDPEEVALLLAAVRRRFGPVEILINNAGTMQVGPWETMTLADYEHALAIHFWAPLRLMLACLPDMRRRGAGRIVNISSLGGKLSAPHLLPHNASKFALAGLSQGLHAELAREGIRITTVYPGLIRTGSPSQALFKGQHRKEYAWFSISDSLPLVTMSAPRAAQRILDACRCGDAEVILTWPAVLGAKMAGLWPGLLLWGLDRINRWLPGPGGIGQDYAKGYASRSRWAPSIWTVLGDQAAEANNEWQVELRGRPHRARPLPAVSGSAQQP